LFGVRIDPPLATSAVIIPNGLHGATSACESSIKQ
jgi:hypothetical protein